jgi:Omp85 superfamily domain
LESVQYAINRVLRVGLILAGILFIPGLLHAQDDNKFIPLVKHPKNDTIVPVKITRKADTVAQLDLYDVISGWFGKKGFSSKTDSVGVKPVLSVVPALGYTLQSKLALTLAGNIAFRLSPDAKISTVIINTAYTQTKQIIIPIQSSIWSKNGNYNFVGDIRFLKYPESTWGLGSNSSISDEDPMTFSFFRFSETVLHRIYPNVFLGIGYIFDDHFNISEKGTIDGDQSLYKAYGAQARTISSGLTLNALVDSRDNSINPLRGWYAAATFRDNTDFWGSTRDWQSLVLDVRKYLKLSDQSDNVLALWSYDWLVLGGYPPYLDLPSTTWDTFSGTGRGYIQGRFRGAEMLYAEAEYRFGITRNGLIGGVVFANAQSFSAAPGTALQSIQPAFGPGIRLKLNKVSKTNIAIDYGFGMQGSHGVFINVGEIF